MRKRRSVAQSGQRQSRSDQRLIHLADGLGGFPVDVDDCGANDDGAGGEAPEEEAVGTILTGLRSGVGLRQRDRGASWASLPFKKSDLCAGRDVVEFVLGRFLIRLEAEVIRDVFVVAGLDAPVVPVVFGHAVATFAAPDVAFFHAKIVWRVAHLVIPRPLVRPAI